MKLVKILGLVLAALIVIWQLWFPATSLRYKVSIDLDDNGVMRHGAGVLQVNFQSQGPLLIDNVPHWTIEMTGETIPVDLGARGTFYALLDPSWGRGDLAHYFGFYFNDLRNDFLGEIKIWEFAWNQKPVDVSPKLLRLVCFRDQNDPTTVEKVDPEHLDESFGPGVRIVNVRAEITHEPVTRGIEKRLP